MKAGLCIAAISIIACGALAQQTDRKPSPAGQTAPQTQQQAPTGGQAGGQAAMQDTSSKTASGQLPEMKTKTHKGILVDAACALPHGASAGASSSAETSAIPTSSGVADRSAEQVADSTPAIDGGKDSKNAKKADAANRVVSDQAACPVSASTNQLALKLDDGRTLPFDLVGNQRAQDAFKTKTKWQEAASSGKPIRVKVSGVTSGEKLIVSSID